MIELSRRDDYDSHGYLVPLAALWAATAQCDATTMARSWIRSLGFSVSYLIFMVPVPEVLITPFIARLQRFVSAAAIRGGQLLGMSVYRDGNEMHLPSGDSLFVAEACSRITSIVTLVPPAVFLAYFSQQRRVRDLLDNLPGILTHLLGCLAILATGGLMNRYRPPVKVHSLQ